MPKPFETLKRNLPTSEPLRLPRETTTLWCNCEVEIPENITYLEDYLLDEGILELRNEGPKEITRCTLCGKERSE